jgi:hypothetical protein
MRPPASRCRRTAGSARGRSFRRAGPRRRAPSEVKNASGREGTSTRMCRIRMGQIDQQPVPSRDGPPRARSPGDEWTKRLSARRAVTRKLRAVRQGRGRRHVWPQSPKGPAPRAWRGRSADARQARQPPLISSTAHQPRDRGRMMMRPRADGHPHVRPSRLARSSAPAWMQTTAGCGPQRQLAVMDDDGEHRGDYARERARSAAAAAA